MTRLSIRPSRAAVFCLLVAWSARGAAHADLWSLDSRVESRLEHNSNYRLEPAPTLGVSTLVMTGGLSAVRETETVGTRLSADLSVFETWPSQQRKRSALLVDLRQTVHAADANWAASIRHARESTADKPPEASEIGLGRVERSSANVGLSGSRALDERLSTRAGMSATRTGFDGGLGAVVGFREASLNFGVSYRLNERDTTGLQIDRGTFRAESAATSYQTSIHASWQRALGDNDSASLSVGAYRSAARSVSEVLVCPLPVEFCRSGLVSPIVAQQVGRTQSSGTLFDAALTRQLDEVTQVSATVSRRLTAASAAAISRSQAGSINFSRAIAPTLAATASASYSQARFIGGDVTTTPRVRGLTLGLTRSFSPDLSMALDVQRSRSDSGTAGPSAVATVVALTLRVQAPRNRLSP